MSYIGIGVYVRHSVEALDTYIRAFGLELGYNVKNDDGSFFHSELNKDGEPFLCVVENDSDPCRDNPVSMGYTFGDKDELMRAFEILKQDGKILLEPTELPWSPWATEVVDRFGIRWYLTVPQHRPADDFTPADCN